MADSENKEEAVSADSDSGAATKNDDKTESTGAVSESADYKFGIDGSKTESGDAKTESNLDSGEKASGDSKTESNLDSGEPAPEPAPGTDSNKPLKMTQHHVSNILDEVLDQPKLGTDKHGYKHPMVLDLILAIGLLVAMGGFTMGLINIYITHQAEQSIMQRNYRAAITVLRGAPLAGFFTMPGADPADLLNQALYLDAMERLDANGEDDTALKDLEKIQAGSRYFDIAQEILKEHFIPAERQLEGKAEHQATPEEAQAPKKPILPPAETDATP